ncbi:galactose-binding domain-containing protein [Acetobacter cerevisiae]|uniref:F5/8 type C domain-containing protein n=1 Tax=Acetobacter cerevisiae TaxID=178900 RepID=A0A149V656_9PROT|nr:discoidin domain-containing protein [Acetobacter cerevisiae]KXV75586.1 hypothetical protein AD954_14605 [Acetobacter cerevisiae]
MAIIDCFSFFNEFDLLDIRLAELNDVVDHFILCESTYTYMGQPKPLHFLENKERYKKYAHKIIHVPVTDYPENINQFQRDAFQREKMMDVIRHCSPDDLIIHTDIDEIPRVEAIKSAAGFDGITYMSMWMYQYYLNLLERKDWWHGYAIPKKHLDRICSFKNAQFSSGDIKEKENYFLTFIRYALIYEANQINISFQIRENSGWHFTNMGGLPALEKKFHSYAHADDPWPNLMKDRNRLKQQIDIGARIFHFEGLAEYFPIDTTFPRFVQENIKSLTKKGYIGDIYAAHKNLQKMYIKMRRNYALRDIANSNQQEDFCYLKPLRFLEFVLCEQDAPPIDMDRLPIPLPKGKLISEGKKATQSSRCAWSKGATCEEDASQVLIGSPTGQANCHTDLEENPWWTVDLEKVHQLSEIRIFNRVFPDDEDHSVMKRLQTLQISTSTDGKIYRTIYFHDNKHLIGGLDGKPLIFTISKAVNARFVRLSLNEKNCLHLDKVYIYGV